MGRIEIVDQVPCPRCDGTRVYDGKRCGDCSQDGTVSIVLATFTDDAELYAAIDSGIGCSSGDIGSVPRFAIQRATAAVLATLGVNEK